MSFDLGYVVFSEHVLTLYSHATKCSGAVISILYICICMYQEPVNRKIEIPTELTEYIFFLIPLLNKCQFPYYFVIIAF